MYNFDKIIDRENTNAMNTDGYMDYLFAGQDIEISHKKEDLVRMWVADMDFEIAPEILDAIRERLDHGILGYSKIFDPDYYKVVHAWTKRRYGWTFKREHLVSSPGVIPALYELLEYLVKADEKVLILTPSYAFFKHAVDYNHLELVKSDLIAVEGRYEIDFEDVKTKLEDPKVTMAIFCNPHNPTGRVWTEEELRQFGDLCFDNNVTLISDEIHSDLLRKEFQHIPMDKLYPDEKRLITCFAPSKTFNMAGMAISNVVIKDPEIRKIWDARHLTFENPLSVAGAKAAYEKGQDWLDGLIDYLDGNFEFLKDFLDERLPETNFKISEATYLAWVNIAPYVNEDNLTKFFAEKAGVLLEGGNMFVDNSDGYIRLNLAVPRSVLEKGLNRIYDAVK
ncbi:putative C-S lyase [Acidaminobacter sp. JC074]|uniref:MalY/PatB family protein n=1 Tax=Acidaminobacter sp. JC074 TaxID=2530199 RepID=UPI001F0FFF88|nr:PatB family C-S lyase [Acidaminobacter sp. JC074]MCH4889451.1 putative C-S lyase [Acidaminobacter sp. JC074]